MAEKFVEFEQYCRHCSNLKKGEDEEPCCTCLSSPTNTDSHAPLYFDGKKPQDDYGRPKTFKKIKDFLYEVSYDTLDKEFAYNYLMNRVDTGAGGCSSYRYGRFYGRNYDWFYDNSAEFLVRTPNAIGIAGNLPIMEPVTDISDDLFKVVPFAMLDGINKWGVVCNVNVVPMDWGASHGTNLDTYKATVPASAMVRYILDNFKTATSAVGHLARHANILFSKSLHVMGYETHFMIADAVETYVVEIIGEHVTFKRRPFMTNFHLFNTDMFETEGYVLTPETQDETHNAIATNHVTPYGAGLERYNYLSVKYEYGVGKTRSEMRGIMNDLFYSRAYITNEDHSDPYWYTEFVSPEYGLTCASTTDQFQPIVEKAGELYLHRDRNRPDTWHTVHSSVYDIQNKKLYLVTQEDGQEMEFSL